jgi:Na+/H+ antiporter NhaD/arsenite permease-like protein
VFSVQAWVLLVFGVTYLGMAAGRIPGLRIDRTGIVLLASLSLLLVDRSLVARAPRAIDFQTLLVLASLMLVSAQLELNGFYDRVAYRLSRAEVSPTRLLLLVVLAVGTFSALLTNDVVVFALTPTLIAGLRSRGLDPKPYLLAAACASNAGSAATSLGNPQNVLIAQAGAIGFGKFFLWCAVPALGSSLVTVAIVQWLYRGKLAAVAVSGEVDDSSIDLTSGPPPMVPSQIGKGLVALLAMVLLLLSPAHDVFGMVFVALLLFLSRVHSTRELLSRVDWSMLLLFVGLFLVNDALAATGLPARWFAALSVHGLDPTHARVLLPLSLLGSNTVGNVPLVTLLLSVWKHARPESLLGLSLLATLSGNFLLVGSVANLIVVERAAAAHVRIRFWEHARVGVPVTLVTLFLATGWLLALGAIVP